MPRALKLTKDSPAPVSGALLELGANLRLACERRGLSIRALAIEIDASLPTVMSVVRPPPALASTPPHCSSTVALNGCPT
jgi:hypothetical protein